jgi:uncharacterized beta-barrel protein YwiB (DUF1934 family)
MENQNSNIIELVTEGKYYRKGNAYYITYQESEVTGMDGTTTTLKISDGIVTLMRFGSVNSQFIFQQGHKHVSYYDTSHGAFTIGVFANEVSINVNDTGGEISVDYELEIDNNKSGENDFYMLIREAGQSND